MPLFNKAKTFSLTLLITLIATVACGQEIKDYQIKAAWIFTLIDYTKWDKDPHNGNTKKNLCTVGFDNIYITIKNIYKTENTKINFIEKEPEDNFTQCHLLYIAASEKDNINAILDSSKNKSIVTISDINRFTERGGIVGFIQENQKITLKLNLKNALKVGIAFDSDLRGLVEVIY